MTSNHPTFNVNKREQTINLGAGPSSLPTSVLLEAAQGILDYQQTGMGLIELSHRSSTFKTLIDKAESDLRLLLSIPINYSVLFVQGGGTEQFSATLLNLLAVHAMKHPGYIEKNKDTRPPVDYVVTGSWTSKASKEAKRLGANVNLAVDVLKTKGRFGSIPQVSNWSLSPIERKPVMLYYCDNETVDGVEFGGKGFPIDQLPKEYRDQVPIVADCSSNILSRPIDISAHGIVFFGAQKNVGPSGVTIVIIRNDLIIDPDQAIEFGGPRIPTTLVYKNAADNQSLFNTPPMFSIYASALVFADLLENKGGVQGACQRALEKSKAVYSAIENSQGVFQPTVQQKQAQSRMNITFRVCNPKTGQPDESLEEKFVACCADHHIVQVKGHRSVGGIRTSLYNAVTVQQTLELVRVMNQFIQQVVGELQ